MLLNDCPPPASSNQLSNGNSTVLHLLASSQGVLSTICPFSILSVQASPVPSPQRIGYGLAAALLLSMPWQLVTQARPALAVTPVQRRPSRGPLGGPIANRQQQSYNERAAAILQHFAQDRRRQQLLPSRLALGFYYRMAPLTAMAQFALGQDQKANRLLAETLNQNLAALKHDQCFLVLWFMDVYLRYKHRMPPRLRRKIRQFVTRHPKYIDGFTPNHHLMFAIGGYLAAQEWPNWSRAPQVRRVTQAHITRFLFRLSRDGMQEHDSPVYHLVYLNSVLSLQDHAQDPLLRRQARIGLELLLITMAPEWLQGYWGASTARTFFFSQDPYIDRGIGTVGWLYWQGIKPYFWGHAAVMHAVSPYRPPTQIRWLAQDRRQPYVHRETHGFTRYRPRQAPKPIFREYKYTYMERQYVLSSQVEGLGRRHWPHQMQRMGLSWLSTVPGAMISIKQPTKGLRGEHPGAGQQLQHQGALLGIYTKPVSVFTPNNPSIVDQFGAAGWSFFHGGSVLVGLRLIKDAPLVGTVKTKLPYKGTPTATFYHYRSSAATNAVILQTAPVEDYAGGSARATLKNFAAAVRSQTTVRYSQPDAKRPSLTYRDLKGNRLSITFNQAPTINGQVVNYQQWPWIENPRIQSSPGEFLTIRHGNYTRHYDLTQWTIRDSLE